MNKSMPQKITNAMMLADFIETLSRDVHTNPAQWSNSTLADYLESMSAWLRDMDGYYANQGLETPAVPTWQFIADLLSAAKFYE